LNAQELIGLQWIAAIAGAISVFLSARENIWSWPTAIVNVSLSAFIFFTTGLYSDMGLQIVFLVLSIYGWYQWLHGGAQHSRLTVSRATPRMRAACGVIGVVAWLAIGSLTSRLPGVSLPYLDAGLTSVSLIAQWMMTRKILENWVLWIIADIVYVPMYLYKDLIPTAGLYAMFLVLAVLGFVQWRRSYASERSLSTGAAVAAP
jgi:nicotinamide mononucleotide transporter